MSHELAHRFKKKHVLGSANLKKSKDRKNHVINLRKAKVKSVTKIERELGKFPGQSKVVTDCPSKFMDTGWELYGEEGEAFFLLTGIKRGMSFVGHHADSIVTKIDGEGIFVDPSGIKWGYLYDSESAEYSSGHDYWEDDDVDDPPEENEHKNHSKDGHEKDWHFVQCVDNYKPSSENATTVNCWSSSNEEINDQMRLVM